MTVADRELIERQRDHFNRIASAYLRGRAEPNHIMLKNLIWDEALAGLPFDERTSLKVLEPMCGSAEGIEILGRRVASPIEYRGFDYSAAVVEAAAELHPNAKIWVDDVTRIVIEPNSYDLIILIGGLHHVPDSASSVVRNLSQGLKSGGLFVNFEPTAGNPLFRWVRRLVYRKNDIFDETTERDFSPAELFCFFEQAGMRPWRIIYPGLSAYVLHYNPYAFKWLNIGTSQTVRALFRLDSLLSHNRLGRALSFATLSIWQKP